MQIIVENQKHAPKIIRRIQAKPPQKPNPTAQAPKPKKTHRHTPQTALKNPKNPNQKTHRSPHRTTLSNFHQLCWGQGVGGIGRIGGGGLITF